MNGIIAVDVAHPTTHLHRYVIYMLLFFILFGSRRFWKVANGFVAHFYHLLFGLRFVRRKRHFLQPIIIVKQTL